MFTAQTSDDARGGLARGLGENMIVVIDKQFPDRHRDAPDRRRNTKFGEMLVLYPALRKRRLQRLLREAGLPRYRVRAHVDDHIDAIRRQTRQKALESNALVTNGIDAVVHLQIPENKVARQIATEKDKQN